jgi:hypothetical protein
MLRWPWPKVIAHRCGGALAPENTLAGLAIAARIGCRAVEFDVMLSGTACPCSSTTKPSTAAPIRRAPSRRSTARS